MEIPTQPGKAYVLTCQGACLVHAPIEQTQYLLLDVSVGGQYAFVAPATKVIVSDPGAKVTESFKEASPGLSAGGGSETCTHNLHALES